MSAGAPAAAVRPLVVIHNGVHGIVTAGPSSLDTIGRERRDRIRAAWLNIGWAWDTSSDMVPVCDPAGDMHDLAVIAALLLVVDPDLPDPPADAIRFVGVARLDGGVTDGVVTLPRAGRAVVVTRIDQLPALIAEAAAS